RTPHFGHQSAARYDRRHDRFGGSESGAGAGPLRTSGEMTDEDRKPRLLHVTGMSGAGKSTVLDSLEDMGWECVDNLPVALLDEFVSETRSTKRPMAVGMD